MSEVPQMINVLLALELIWSCVKNYLSVPMSLGDFDRLESFRWLFPLTRNC